MDAFILSTVIAAENMKFVFLNFFFFFLKAISSLWLAQVTSVDVRGK